MEGDIEFAPFRPHFQRRNPPSDLLSKRVNIGCNRSLAHIYTSQ